MNFVNTFEFELLVFGCILLALLLVPVPFLNALGNKINGIIYKLHFSSPIPKVLEGTVSLSALVGMFSLFVASIDYMLYYNRHISRFDARSLLPDGEHAKRFRSERNMYLWSASAAVYLALHTFARIQDRDNEDGKRQAANLATAAATSTSRATVGGAAPQRPTATTENKAKAE